STYDAPPGLGAPPAYGAQPTAPPEYGALPGVGAPPEYGAPPGVGAPPEYGAPPPYLPPGGYGSPPGYGGARPGGFAPGYGQRTNDKATLALILGIVGLVICQIASVFAIVIGGKALREIQYSGGTESGEGMAKAGRILGWIGVCIFVLAIIAIFGLGLLGHTTRSVYTPVPTGN
ncbi:MAG: DUF4190 domain-containing protein, partial [Actinobacteria bacterium]|nr:DUF4190 domain-containing protein [Actinomycetota bacterium]